MPRSMITPFIHLSDHDVFYVFSAISSPSGLAFAIILGSIYTPRFFLRLLMLALIRTEFSVPSSCANAPPADAHVAATVPSGTTNFVRTKTVDSNVVATPVNTT
eukprot:jgi/Psemu1/58913/gm1.58913_g